MNAGSSSSQVVIRHLALCVVSALLIGCGRFGGHTEPAAVSTPVHGGLGAETESVAPIPEVWASGLYLPAGNRSAVAEGGVGWIVTQPFEDDRLLLTKLTMVDGKIATSVLAEHVASYSGAGLAPDGAGNLWITYGDQAVRLDESTGKLDRWALSGLIAEDVGSSDDWSAGNAQAAAWERREESLLFVKNGDHYLYRFDPRAGTVTAAADLGVYTTYLSSLVVGDDGSVGVTGTATHGAYVPAAEWIVGGKSVLIPDADSLCLAESKLVVLGRDGGVSSVESNQASLVSRVPPLRTTGTPFACAGGMIFEAAEGDGRVAATRISMDGKTAQLILPLIKVGGAVHPYLGEDITGDYAGAGVQALIPDQHGGVWLVLIAGSQDLPGVRVTYPSVIHVDFD